MAYRQYNNKQRPTGQSRDGHVIFTKVQGYLIKKGWSLRPIVMKEKGTFKRKE